MIMKKSWQLGRFEITMHEILASITIIAVMMILGFVFSGKIEENQMDKNAEYYKATKITETEMFQYGMDTNIGNAFVYGDLEAVDTCRDKLFYDDDSVVENIINTISYYFDKYHEHTGGFHPRMSDQTLIKVIEKLVEGSKDFEDLISFDNGYYSLIDKHFTVNYGKNIDWHLPHFATEGIIQRLAYKSDYY